MSDRINIESIFKDGFDGFKVEPDASTWKSIEQKLGTRNLDQMNKEAFEKITIEPNASVWTNIYKKLIWVNFLRFSPTSFNIYYLNIALTTIVGLCIFLGFPTKNDEITTSDNGSNEAIIASLTPDITNAPSTNTTALFPGISEDNSSHLVEHNDISITETTPEMNTSPDAKNSDSTKNTSNKPFATKENTQHQVKLPVTQPVSQLQEKPSFPDNLTNAPEKTVTEDQNKTEADVLPSETIMEGQELQTIEKNNLEKDVRIEDLPQPISPELKTEDVEPVVADNELPSDEEITAIDNKIDKREVQPLDNELQGFPILNRTENGIAAPDTVGKDCKGHPIVMLTDRWSAGLFTSPAYTRSMLSANSTEFDAYVKTRSNAEYVGMDYFTTSGVDVNYSHKKWLFQSGIHYSRFGEEFSYATSAVYDSSYYDIKNWGYYQIDTIMFQNIDSLLAGVTYYEPYIQRTWKEETDSVFVSIIDTVKGDSGFFHNHYSYVEIPLIFGYEVDRGDFTVFGKVGLITGIFINAEGKTTAPYESSTYMKLHNDLPFNKVAFSAYASLGLSYSVTDRVGIFGEVYYRQGLTSTYQKDYYISQKHRLSGVKLGVNYTFRNF